MARALRCRVRNCRLSQGFEQRWFSDSSEKEKQALLRALSPNKTKPRTKKKATFDHFFANMDKPSEKASRSSPTTRPRRQLAGSNTSETSNNKNSHVDKKVNISSFFDEVNAIMERTKAANDIDNKDVPKKKSKAGTSTVSSLFDILPPPKQFNPNAYPEDAFDSYSELFEITMRSRVFLGRHKNSRLDDDQEKSVLDWLKTDEPVVTHNLPFLEKAAKEGIASSAEEEQAPELLRSELQTQKNIFMDHHGWSDSQYNGAMGALSNLGNLCAKHASAPALEISWQKMKEAGYTPDKKTLNVYLYVSSTFSVRPIRVKSGSSVLDFLGGTDSDNDEKEAQEDRKEKKDFEAKTDAASEVAICHDLFHEPSEQSTSIRVRMLVSQGKAKEAERLLDTNSVRTATTPIYLRGPFQLKTYFHFLLFCRRATISDFVLINRCINAILTKEMFLLLSNYS